MIECSWIENMISVETDGWTRPCCGEPNESARISKLETGILKSFNHPRLLFLKQELSSNGFSNRTDFACVRCRQLENLNQPSLRTNTPFLSTERKLKAIQFKLSNRCQLACAHCGPDLSSTWRKILEIKPHVKDEFQITENFLQELATLLPDLEYIKFTGGEPFLDPNHYKILEYLNQYDRKHCKLVYITNGLIRPRNNLWEGWKEVNCMVSVDGFEETYEWFRRGAVWNELIENIQYLRSTSNLSINYSVTPWTVNSYKDAKKYFSGTVFNHTLIVTPNYSSMINFPRHIATKYFTDFVDITSESGDIQVYRDFAKKWDSIWKTEGKSEKLFPWLIPE
jgi:hypothetical protein